MPFYIFLVDCLKDFCCELCEQILWWKEYMLSILFLFPSICMSLAFKNFSSTCSEQWNCYSLQKYWLRNCLYIFSLKYVGLTIHFLKPSCRNWISHKSLLVSEWSDLGRHTLFFLFFFLFFPFYQCYSGFCQLPSARFWKIAILSAKTFYPVDLCSFPPMEAWVCALYSIFIGSVFLRAIYLSSLFSFFLCSYGWKEIIDWLSLVAKQIIKKLKYWK